MMVEIPSSSHKTVGQTVLVAGESELFANADFRD